ncbi:PRP1 splicing factor, N-terminal-domain-containing protein [Amanita rubescens]|nr:PRP1 splicing factor, N-terminal-domain-containing protein [Amanita rubescens]KAF8341194.1 PRP1 splicing factor, N-terminal-domain-containing protein [Amanita rubescens]
MASKDKSNKLAFLSMPAPASYVAGLGRGASGFTTRSDIGPAREGPSAEVIAEAQMRRGEEPEYDPDAYHDPENETGLFAGTVYEADDEEADRIYAFVDDNMDRRRKTRREAREAAEATKLRSERPKIQHQFADLKRGLSSVTDEEWENLPEVGNLTKKRKTRETRFFVVPDSVIVGDRDKIGYETHLSAEQQLDGTATTVGETTTDFVELGTARDKVLSLKLDQASSSASGLSTSINPKDYLTDLNSVVLKSEAEIGDIKRARMLFDSLTKSNPKHAPGWIAAARVEEHAGRMVAARKIIMKGCEECPKSEDVWLEASRLHNDSDTKVILARAVQHVGQSIKIWLQAANLEHDVEAKKRVLRKALEVIPNSARLWKVLVNLETNQVDARVLLTRAVELIPHSVELWLALARLGNSQHAKAVLNKARKSIPTSHEIWIAAAQLLEQEAIDEAAEGKEPKSMEIVDKTIEMGVRELRKHGVLFTREQWLQEAERCDEGGKPRTCEAIVKATVAMEVEEEDRYTTWAGEVEAMEGKGRIATARAVLAYALKVFPNRVKLWERAAYLEQSHGTGESREALLQRAVEHCPQAEVLWLMWAKKKWEDGDVPAAREVLEKAFLANPESEAIWLAAVKLEAENGQFVVARALLTRARMVAGTPRIWMKAVVFERQQGQLDTALSTLEEAITKFPKFAKLYMIQGQIHQSKQNYPQARAAYAAGLKSCSNEPVLWILASRLEEADNKSIKARALLDKARLIMPNNDELWAEAVRVEERSSGAIQAKSVLSRAIQACPASGLLWSMLVWSEPRPTRKARATDAMTKSGKHPLVICTVARLFWQERKIEKAREWFDRAAKAAGADELDSGDIWAWWYRFEKEQGTKEHQQEVIDKCTAAAPRHGHVWQAVAKDPKNAGKNTKEVMEIVAPALS